MTDTHPAGFFKTRVSERADADYAKRQAERQSGRGKSLYDRVPLAARLKPSLIYTGNLPPLAPAAADAVVDAVIRKAGTQGLVQIEAAIARFRAAQKPKPVPESSAERDSAVDRKETVAKRRAGPQSPAREDSIE